MEPVRREHASYQRQTVPFADKLVLEGSGRVGRVV